jgi:Na+-driven multidrug efflux pump
MLRPSVRPPHPSWAPFREILRVDEMSAVVIATTNLTIAIITSYVGTAGVTALAGYGAGARLGFILVSLSYGIGGPAGILIGTNIGAGQGGRALRTAWIGWCLKIGGSRIARGSKATSLNESCGGPKMQREARRRSD